MKAYTRYNNYGLTILSIIILFLVQACSTTRGLKGNQVLVRKITINGVDKQYQEAIVNYVDKEQQPNNWLNLQFYYAFSRHGKKDIGEAPRILDSDLVEFSRVQIEKFLAHRGYLKAKVEDKIRIKGKKAELIFNATEGPLFRIQKLQDSIEDPHVKTLYNANKALLSQVKAGDPFDVDSLASEREGIFQLMKRNGYYDFFRQSINYNYDTAFNKSAVAVTRIISNPPDDDKHEIYTINNTTITIYNSYGRAVGKADTMRVDSQFIFVDYSHRFKPSALTNYIFQRKGDQYNIEKQNLTTSRLSELNVFRNVPNPTYTKTADSTNRLDSRIDIIPLKHMANRIEGEFIFNRGHTGFNIDNTFTDRNLFKGAEILQLKLSWSVLFNGAATAGNSIQNQDFKAGLNLVYPRIISPFKLPIPGKYGVPHTTISSNYQLFFQEGLVSRKSFINSITYDWAETTQKLHSLTPINIEFSKGIIDPVAQTQLIGQNRYSYVYLIGRTIFTAGSQYSYQLNANKLYTANTFTYFRGTIDAGGNTLSLMSKLLNTRKDTLGQRTLLGQTFAQYTKAETDLRFYRRLGTDQALVFRFNAGIGVPYDNSSQLIFEKDFYGGGSNDIRAWLPRTLGPGQFNRATAYGSDTSLRSRLKYLDQFGEIKLVGNLEYRFGLIGNFFGSKLNGAFFTDFGNVWRLKPETDSPNGAFDFSKLFQSTAIGIGTGLRFDLSFFVFRLDMAFKFKDPQFTGSDQWVLLKHGDELFRAGAFKHNYQVANSGDPYSFMQLNFGIGLPF
ncbi:BamA/TamA family outer membrane protein [Mucilaginibacter sp. PPCGB 2223]|uniref:translocation and assembly module lipoprotein TamL n=1 Tax=Mucilaginibacter sp. PPCGB 2223 TaxID=1886027 RepID=UPI0009F38D26|nr:BamA/TamA family outer membrane protein [Mucilaginibacter sp. PPCGB 2223]